MYDYILVGAGSAGCVLANRLSADPGVRVLLLEAGGPDDKREIHIPAAFSKLFKTPYDWAYETEPEPNLAPPYGAIVIGETASLSAVPALDANSSSTQAVADRVRLVLYGLQSNEAIDFLNAVLQYSRDTQNFGLMSMPAVVDERRPQTELQAIAMKKTIDFRVSYTQGRVNTVAQKLILSALPTVLVQRT